MAEKNTVVSEREYVIPLKRDFLKVPRYERASRTVKTIKKFIARHMNVRDGDLDKVKLDKHLNNHLWERGKFNPPTKVKVKAVRDGLIVRVDFVEVPEKIKFQKAKVERRHKPKAEPKSPTPKKEESEKKEESVEEKKEEKEKAASAGEFKEKQAKQQQKEQKHVQNTKVKAATQERKAQHGH